MKKLLFVSFALLIGTITYANNADVITINYEVTAINELEITDASVTLTVDAATAGQEPDQATDATTYDITTNAALNSKKITGILSTAMPAGLTLQADVTAPTGGASAGFTTLTDSAVDLVNTIEMVAEAGIAIDFTLDALVSAGVVESAAKVLTLTLTDEI
jgi:hypothetical protein